MIRDLLNPSSGILELREDAKGGTQVAGLSQIKARSTDEVITPHREKNMCEIKNASQLWSKCTADQRLCFCLMNRKVLLCCCRTDYTINLVPLSPS